MKRFLAGLLLAALPLYIFAIDFPLAGFSIPVLDDSSSLPDNTSQTRLYMFTDGGTDSPSNVNVMIQGYTGSIESYMELSETQLEDYGWEILTSSIQGEAYFSEFIGFQNGQSFHFYSKAISNGKYIYLATATVPEERWLTDADLVIPVVDGLELY